MTTKNYPGIFNDVIGPIMRGPSSSHTAAAQRIGSLIRQTGAADFRQITVTFDPHSALATTYHSQGSAMGLAGGLLGLALSDPKIIAYEELLEQSHFSITYRIAESKHKHPNAYHIRVQYREREDLHLIALSHGGGAIELVEWNGFPLSCRGLYHEILITIRAQTLLDENELAQLLIGQLPDAEVFATSGERGTLFIHIKSTDDHSKLLSRRLAKLELAYQIQVLAPVMPAPPVMAVKPPFTTVAAMLALADRDNLSLADLASCYEEVCSGRNKAAIVAQMGSIVDIIGDAIELGLAGTEYADRILGAQSPRLAAAVADGRIQNDINCAIIAKTAAIMEVKSSLGVIVAAPTAGSCGVLGGVLFAVAERDKYDRDALIRAFLAAGIAGVFIAEQYTFAAESGGCQVETGAASAMAAAALVELSGGSARQAIDAAAMALQNMLGLICDPVALRVELPCLGKNIMAASNAYNAYIMSMAGFATVIPYAEVISAMRDVGAALPASLCCTGGGGLAQTPTARHLQQLLLPVKQKQS
jgi:L-serine dehydratase